MVALTAAVELYDAARRYRVGKQLAAGDVGDTFVAVDTLSDRQVAYKRLRVKSESARARATALFEREYDTLTRLAHPNIVEVYDYGFDVEGPYYTLELLSGADLTELAPLPLGKACQLVRDVASALGVLHARRMLHRNVSPANVRLTPDGRAKLLNFSALARFGRPPEIAGAPAFVAPESLSEQPLDQRADLYSLGALAYWALTGRLPYSVRTISELTAAWQTPLLAPSAHAPEVTKELDELVLSLLARDPAARPATTAHLIDKLTAIAALAPEPDEPRVARSYLTHPPFVGRAQLLRDLSGYVQEAQQGRGRAVLLRGAAGLGRSALLDQLVVDAQLVGAAVLRWHCDTKNGSFGLGHSLLAQLRCLFPDAAKSVVERDSMLDSAYGKRTPRPGLEGTRGGIEASERQARRVQLLQDCLLQVSRRMPLVLLVDDIQIADPQSLALLASLARALAKYPLLLVVTARAGAGCTDPNALADLDAQATSVTLEPIEESHVAELVKTLFGDVPNGHRLARWLHAQSAGNPGHCVELSRRLLQSGEITYRCGTFDLPYDPHVAAEDLAALQLARLAELSPEALTVARLLSIQERAMDFLRLGAASRLEPRKLLRATSELSAHGIARRVGAGLGFATESLRGALAQALPDDERKALHSSVARAILATGERGAETKFEACHHLLYAGLERQAADLACAALQNHAFAYEATPSRVPLLEEVLTICRRQGRPDEHNLMLLVPLVRAGFWGDLAAQARHLDAAFGALANVSGMTLARKLAPWLGKKLALSAGMLCARVRHLLISKTRRFPSFAHNIKALLGAACTAASAASNVFDPETAARVVGYLDPLAAMSKRSGAYLTREFCIATAELGAGRLTAASRRYGWLLDRLDRPVRGLDDYARARLVDGCLHGRAEAEQLGSKNGAGAGRSAREARSVLCASRRSHPHDPLRTSRRPSQRRPASRARRSAGPARRHLMVGVHGHGRSLALLQHAGARCDGPGPRQRRPRAPLGDRAVSASASRFVSRQPRAIARQSGDSRRDLRAYLSPHASGRSVDALLEPRSICRCAAPAGPLD
jgi:hypothetical protein